MTNYSQIKPGLFLNNNSLKENVLYKYKNTSTLVFDFDGTLTKEFALGIVSFKSILKRLSRGDFKQLKYLVEAVKLIFTMKALTIEETSEEFAKCIKGLNEKDFLIESKFLYKNIYPKGIEFIKKARLENKNTYVVSLSDKKILSKPLSKLQIDKFCARELDSYNGIYSGKFKKKMPNSQKLKFNFLKRLVKNKQYIYFGNDLDDKTIIENAKLRIGINPKEKILSQVEFDIIATGKDPWENLETFFSS
jgi:phosphoserine phosphatase